MAYERYYDILINVPERTRKRLDLVKAIIRLQKDGLANPTWADAVQWLTETVPIPQLLASACAEVTDQAHTGE